MKQRAIRTSYRPGGERPARNKFSGDLRTFIAQDEVAAAC